MTRALALSQRQAQTLLRAAEAERGIVEVKIGSAVFRLIPASIAQAPKAVDDDVSPEAFDTLDEYLAWRDRSGAGGA
ncbi:MULTISPECIES: hypothetical protein [Mesorhizobium]|uniref:Uncharacterized protein n=2 Tax=Mesorhizobium TaxID=68287 RepID=A0A1A5ICV2_RHILI|nr:MULTISPECIES: hypothetical protein [Mesorhizobium]ETA72297.1 hypothetical protein MesloDRAFT_1165 [Mesorhizobium japonicum R7A]MBE1709630.1 hypothetical protein [Mesorhizobium japonicum]MBE1714299.1 hypothetical protein [Mesorhizobium japonicum]MUT25280.1 hypothetical protein [Mesorhizobium japonicum]MUT28666.1 hypothetical protein [Mesorhizobium japonicum]